MALSACAARPTEEAGRARALAQETRSFTDRGLHRLTAGMDPAMAALARRHDPVERRADPWGRVAGWTSYRIDTAPSLGFGTTFDDTARRINALRPFATLPIRPMRPFILTADAEDRARALTCLTQAVYFEAANESTEGQEAVAQIVLNRVRHPAYPNTVCGVVFQGSARRTGCQFSFTCDGSLAYAPEPTAWARARIVAERALDGFVLKAVGPATHYHADYVAPYWAPTLVKLKQIGAHIFYRWTGPWGEPGAFVDRYGGGEAHLTAAVLGGVDPRTQTLMFPGEAIAAPAPRSVTLDVGGESRTYQVAELAPGEIAPVQGLRPSRRKPTAEEIQRINAALAAFEGAPAPVEAEAPRP